MEIIVNGKTREVDIKGKIRGRELFKKLGLNEEEYLLIVDGKLLPLEEYVKDSDKKVEIIPVISGG